MPRLVLFTSKDSHYSIKKMAAFMGIGSDNVYNIKTDSRGKISIEHLEIEIRRAQSEGAKPFMVNYTKNYFIGALKSTIFLGKCYSWYNSFGRI